MRNSASARGEGEPGWGWGIFLRDISPRFCRSIPCCLCRCDRCSDRKRRDAHDNDRGSIIHHSIDHLLEARDTIQTSDHESSEHQSIPFDADEHQGRARQRSRNAPHRLPRRNKTELRYRRCRTTRSVADQWRACQRPLRLRIAEDQRLREQSGSRQQRERSRVDQLPEDLFERGHRRISQQESPQAFKLVARSRDR